MSVVNIGAGESHSQRDALAIGQDMPFGAELSAIGGVGPVRSPLWGSSNDLSFYVRYAALAVILDGIGPRGR